MEPLSLNVNSYSGTIYHQEGEGEGTPAPWINKFVNDSFGAETLWVTDGEYAADTTFNNCVFHGTNISNLMADVDISHCSGNLSIHVRNIDARYSVFQLLFKCKFHRCFACKP